MEPSLKELYNAMSALFTKKSLVAHNIDSFDAFLTKGIPSIVEEVFALKLEFNYSDDSHVYSDDATFKIPITIKRATLDLTFNNAKIDKVVLINQTTKNLETYTPNMARQSSSTYESKVTTNYNFKLSYYDTDRLNVDPIKVDSFTVRDVEVGYYPIMVMSKNCTLRNAIPSSLSRAYKEDVNEVGGYFIVNGHEWSVDMTESNAYNVPYIYNNNHNKEDSRLEIISKPGDGYENSKQMIIVMIEKETAITVKLVGATYDGIDQSKSNMVQATDVPIQYIMRMLGADSDREIISLITQDDLDNPVNPVLTNKIIDKLEKCMTRYTHNRTNAANSIYNAINRWIDIMNRVIVREEGSEGGNGSDAFNKKIRDNLIFEYGMYVNGSRYTPKLKNVKEEVDPEMYNTVKQHIINDIMANVDKSVFPHLGLDGSETTRRTKLLQMARLIRQLICTNIGELYPSDRDTMVTKRIHTNGSTFSRLFKSIFSANVVNPLRKQMTLLLNSEKNKANINEQILTNYISADKNKNKVSNMIKKASKSAEISGPNSKAKQKLYTQQLVRKNELNTIATLRAISVNTSSASAKSKRSVEIRAVQPSNVGYICICASTDTGEKVGLTKQLAALCSITPAGNSIALERFVSRFLTINLEDLVKSLKVNPKLTDVYINGKLVGQTDAPDSFLTTIRELRLRYLKLIGQIGLAKWNSSINSNDEKEKEKELNRLKKIRDKYRDNGIYEFLSIYRNMNDYSIYIFVDAGRTTRPLIRLEEGNTVQWHNDLKDTSHPKYKELMMFHGFIEWISADEATNIIICDSYNRLNSTKMRYTHLETGFSIFGITAITSPFLQHTMLTRCTYQTNQSKQSCGYYVSNPRRRFDRKKVFQTYCEKPLVSTIINSVLPPNSTNMTVVMMCHTGFNQEDSTIINKNTVERGYFETIHYTCETASISNHSTEEIRLITPDDNVSARQNVNVSFLDERGIIKPGSIIGPDTVLVSKVLTTPSSQFSAIHSTNLSDSLMLDNTRDISSIKQDVSLVYSHHETCEVEDVQISYMMNQKLISLVRVKLKYYRKLVPGDKISTRAGNKNIIAKIVEPHLMPYFLKTGIIPDVIVNPHSVPSRMVTGQMLETMASILALKRGKIIDGTVLNGLKVEQMVEELKTEYPDMHFTEEKMVCGITGELIDSGIAMSFIAMQKLQKFADEEGYSAKASGPTDQLTRQAVSGKANNGGFQFGTMEFDALMGNGVMFCVKNLIATGPSVTNIDVCVNCNIDSVIKGRCTLCNSSENIVVTKVSYVFLLFKQHLLSMGYKMKIFIDRAEVNSISVFNDSGSIDESRVFDIMKTLTTTSTTTTTTTKSNSNIRGGGNGNGNGTSTNVIPTTIKELDDEEGEGRDSESEREGSESESGSEGSEGSESSDSSDSDSDSSSSSSSSSNSESGESEREGREGGGGRDNESDEEGYNDYEEYCNENMTT